MSEVKLENVNLNEDSLLRVIDGGEEKIFHLDRDDNIIPDFYYQLSPENPSIKLEEGIYVDGKIEASAGKKEIPIIPTADIQRVKAEGYFWDEVEVAPAQMVYEGGHDVAEPCDVRAGKYFLSMSGIEQGTMEGSLDDLTDTVWCFNDNVEVSGLVGAVTAYSNRNFNINFVTDDDKGEFEHLYLENTYANGDTFKYGNGLRLSKYVLAYSSHTGWTSENNRWRVIRITGGNDVTNKYLIAWLLTNATKMVSPNN